MIVYDPSDMKNWFREAVMAFAQRDFFGGQHFLVAGGALDRTIDTLLSSNYASKKREHSQFIGGYFKAALKKAASQDKRYHCEKYLPRMRKVFNQHYYQLDLDDKQAGDMWYFLAAYQTRVKEEVFRHFAVKMNNEQKIFYLQRLLAAEKPFSAERLADLTPEKLNFSGEEGKRLGAEIFRLIRERAQKSIAPEEAALLGEAASSYLRSVRRPDRTLFKDYAGLMFDLLEKSDIREPMSLMPLYRVLTHVRLDDGVSSSGRSIFADFDVAGARTEDPFCKKAWSWTVECFTEKLAARKATEQPPFLMMRSFSKMAQCVTDWHDLDRNEVRQICALRRLPPQMALPLKHSCQQINHGLLKVYERRQRNQLTALNQWYRQKRRQSKEPMSRQALGTAYVAVAHEIAVRGHKIDFDRLDTLLKSTAAKLEKTEQAQEIRCWDEQRREDLRRNCKSVRVTAILDEIEGKEKPKPSPRLLKRHLSRWDYL